MKSPDGKDVPVEEGALIWVPPTRWAADVAHIPDGILSLPVLVAGGAIAAAGVGLALRHWTTGPYRGYAMLSAVFFAASLISVPVGPSSVHLLLSGLMGVILGLGVFPPCSSPSSFRPSCSALAD